MPTCTKIQQPSHLESSVEAKTPKHNKKHAAITGSSAADLERFWRNVDKGPHPKECWEWTGHKHQGCPRAIVKRILVIASRFIYFHHYGQLDPKLKVCHRCDNPGCVNPSHLFLATHSQNMRDCIGKGRMWYQQKSHCNRGHPFTPENTYVHPSTGIRECRTCSRKNARIREEKERLQKHNNPMKPFSRPLISNYIGGGSTNDYMADLEKYADEMERKLAEETQIRKQLAGALREVDRLTYSHVKGGIGKAQKVARAAIVASSDLDKQ